MRSAKDGYEVKENESYRVYLTVMLPAADQEPTHKPANFYYDLKSRNWTAAFLEMEAKVKSIEAGISKDPHARFAGYHLAVVKIIKKIA